MPRGGPKMVENLVLPALKSGFYGDTVKWVAEDIFRLKLVHMNKRNWDREYIRIYLDWDKMKKRPTDVNDYNITLAKQRFKNGLGKSKSAKRLKDAEVDALKLPKSKNLLYYRYIHTIVATKKTKQSGKKTTQNKKTIAIKLLPQCSNVSSTLTPPSSTENSRSSIQSNHLETMVQESHNDHTINQSYDTCPVQGPVGQIAQPIFEPINERVDYHLPENVDDMLWDGFGNYLLCPDLNKL